MIDNSVNITGTGRGGGLSNFQAAAAGTALNENQYERSRMKVTGAGVAQEAIDQAEENVGATNRIAGLDRGTDEMSNYYRNLSKKYNIRLFGDIFDPSFNVNPFVPPKPPSKIEVNYDGE